MSQATENEQKHSEMLKAVRVEIESLKGQITTLESEKTELCGKVEVSEKSKDDLVTSNDAL